MSKKQQSEIRASKINELLEKVRKSNYGQYLKSVRLNRVRGFSGTTVIFDFPVTALIGPNGGGKSTVLGAVACAYKDIKPGIFLAHPTEACAGVEKWGTCGF